MYIIENNVELPKNSKYPFLDLEPMQSVFMSGIQRKLINPRLSEITKKTGRVFTCKTEDGGTRVWRIS